MTEHVLQHGDDLDFAQDVLTATAGNPELNPTLNAVLAGFARRKRFGRFKCGQLNLEFDRLRYANTSTPKDSDLEAKEVTQTVRRTTAGVRVGPVAVCHFFQRPAGCTYGVNCRFQHRCIICLSPSHGANSCGQASLGSSGSNQTEATRSDNRPRQSRERPPHPRFRRERAQ